MLTAVALSLLTSVQTSPVEVRLVMDQPKAALAILDKRSAGLQIAGADWQALFRSEGYERLKERELGMKRKFEEDEFRDFMTSDALLAKRQGLGETLAKWQAVDIVGCGAKSLAYLPKGSKLKASVYFLIKPRTNSFVWDLQMNPAVMLYLDPEMSTQELAMTIAHEFHHVGFAGVGYAKAYSDWLEKQPQERKTALTWQGAFGEGFAVLAAAGGPGPDPVGVARKEVRDAWAEGMRNLDRDMRELEQFFLDTLSGKLSAAESQQKAATYYGIQGPWYTVGYHVATVIEKAFGREKLIECFVDPRKLLPLYNQAADKTDVKFRWSPDLLKKLGASS